MSIMRAHHLLLIVAVLLTSCATRKIEGDDIPKLIRSIKGIGEGRGRLGINQNQYLFSYDALLKENFDWLLAANIPLHGEEILVLKNLKKETLEGTPQESFEKRIEQGINEYLKGRNNPQLAREFLEELRGLMRLVLHQQLGTELVCEQKGEAHECQMDKKSYLVEATAKQLSVKKDISSDYRIELIAQNLTDSFFSRSSIFLHSRSSTSEKPAMLSLELFWK